MPLIVTPGQFTQRAELYQQLGALTGAGVGILTALNQLQRHPPARSFRQPLRELSDQLGHGCTMAEALRNVGGWLPEFDIALIDSGERSGRLEACFRLLADYYTDRARVARQMLADLAYPALLLHFAIFILPFPQLFLTGDVAAYLLKTLGVLVPLYTVVILGLIAGQGRHGEAWRSLVEVVTHPIPLLGTARRNLALARLTATLQALLGAGVNIFQSWDMAATASGSPALRRAVTGWRGQLEAGETPGDLLSRSRAFPDLFASHYRAGEVSGSLDESLQHLHHLYYEEGTRQARALARWVPRGIYFVVVLLIAWRIINFWMGYFGNIQNALGA